MSQGYWFTKVSPESNITTWKITTVPLQRFNYAKVSEALVAELFTVVEMESRVCLNSKIFPLIFFFVATFEIDHFKKTTPNVVTSILTENGRPQVFQIGKVIFLKFMTVNLE